MLSALVVIFLCLTYRCQSLSLFPPPPPQQPAAQIQRQYNDQITTTKKFDSLRIQGSTMVLSAIERNDQLIVQTQSQQMSDAMVIKTMRGTQWRVIEDRSSPSSFGKGLPRTKCKSLATFSGFASDANKGTVNVEYMCPTGSPTGSSTATETTSSTAPTFTTSGRWVTKPSRLARGSVQLSARWKVKLPDGGGIIIYKGFINADKIIGKSGKSVSAEMVGVILTGEEVNKETVIGKFTADLVRQLDKDEVDSIRVGETNPNSGPITLSPKITME